jgi:hypothetical protein
MSHAARLATHSTVSASLAKHSDEGLNALVARANPLGSGIGGRSALLDVDGTRVFVKRVPLTAAETLPEHVRSTANLFGLPTFFQYGIGQHGIGQPRPFSGVRPVQPPPVARRTDQGRRGGCEQGVHLGG